MNTPEFGYEKTLLETVKVGTYAVKVYWDPTDIVLKASGFTISFREKPNSPAQVERDARPAASLLDDEASMAQLKELGERWRRKLHESLRQRFGMQHYVPDQNGLWHHPVFDCRASRYHCHHCDKEFSGEAVAANMWHCPSPDCDGSPIDIHPAGMSRL